MPPTKLTKQSYLASLPDDRRAALTVLDRAIRQAAPKLKVKMRDMMGKRVIGYGEFPYTFADGHEGTWFIIGLASNKSYLSLYICCCDAKGYLIDQHQTKLGKVRTGRSCINFKKLEDLNLPVALALVKKAARLGGGLGG